MPGYWINPQKMFQELQWLPIDDIIRIKKLCMMFKIVNQECPYYFTSYRTYIKNTIAITLDYLLIMPWLNRNAGLTLDCKTVRIFAYSSMREQSNKRTGTRLKTESETGERRYGRVRLARFARLRLLRHALPISLLILRKKPDCFAV